GARRESARRCRELGCRRQGRARTRAGPSTPGCGTGRSARRRTQDGPRRRDTARRACLPSRRRGRRWFCRATRARCRDQACVLSYPSGRVGSTSRVTTAIIIAAVVLLLVLAAVLLL